MEHEEQAVDVVGEVGRFEAVAAMEKFPDEIWTIIFQYLQNSSSDLLNCTRVCRKWKRILSPDQCNWIFDQIFPHIFSCLDKKDILTTRQVGRRWRKVVDNLVETHDSRLPFDEKRSKVGRRALASILHYKQLKWNGFYKRETLLRFMSIMGKQQQPETNPFFGRALWLEIEEETEDEDENFQENSKFWSTVFEFLSLYGHHVWYFGLGTYGAKNTYSRFLYLINKCFSLIPNMKSLHIFGWINESGEEGEENSLSVEEIPAFLANHPLPKLPFLETLEISNMSGLPSVVQDHIISRHIDQLKCLQLSEWEENGLAANTTLPQLKEVLAEVPRYRVMDRVESLLTRQLSASPLGKLCLSFNSLETTLDMNLLFEMIGRFGGTLRSLRLTVIPTIPGSTSGMVKNDAVVNKLTSQINFCAPNLQALHLEGFNQLSLSFLAHLSSSLEYLEIRPLAATFRQTCYPDETIDLYQYLHCNNVYDSQIWMDIPKLKTIYFEKCDICLGQYVNLVYSRATYEYLENLKKVPIV